MKYIVQDAMGKIADKPFASLICHSNGIRMSESTRPVGRPPKLWRCEACQAVMGIKAATKHQCPGIQAETEVEGGKERELHT